MANKMTTPPPVLTPIKAERYFTANKLYSDIDWNDWPSAIMAFREMVEGWYLKPIELLKPNGNFAFAVMSLSCSLIDMISQYDAGETQSKNGVFKNYVKTIMPEFKVAVSNSTNPIKDITDFADALYHGLRCGILHEAHPALYTAICKTDTLVSEHHVTATHNNGSHHPTIVIDPYIFSDRIKHAFDNYIIALLQQNNQSIADKFKIKFKSSFGIDIGKEPKFTPKVTQLTNPPAPTQSA